MPVLKLPHSLVINCSETRKGIPDSCPAQFHNHAVAFQFFTSIDDNCLENVLFMYQGFPVFFSKKYLFLQNSVHRILCTGATPCLSRRPHRFFASKTVLFCPKWCTCVEYRPDLYHLSWLPVQCEGFFWHDLWYLNWLQIYLACRLPAGCLCRRIYPR